MWMIYLSIYLSTHTSESMIKYLDIEHYLDIDADMYCSTPCCSASQGICDDGNSYKVSISIYLLIYPAIYQSKYWILI